MAARSKARKRALDVLFEAEIRGEPVLALLDERIAQDSPPVSPYAAELVRGVHERQADIDALLAEHAVGWTLGRMPAVDRNLLRIGAYELLYSPQVPDSVAISEAVVLARELSTDSSPAFVNGLLARLYQLKPEADPPEAGPPETDPPESGRPEAGPPEAGRSGTAIAGPERPDADPREVESLAAQVPEPGPAEQATADRAPS
ncbi:MAG: transcription antitermination factor NusB [Streptosporangiaceae bacterium]